MEGPADTSNVIRLNEPDWSEPYRTRQLRVTHRRDLIHKRAKVQSQFRVQFERCLPGYAPIFPDDVFWQQQLGMADGLANNSLLFQAQWEMMIREGGDVTSNLWTIPWRVVPGLLRRIAFLPGWSIPTANADCVLQSTSLESEGPLPSTTNRPSHLE